MTTCRFITSVVQDGPPYYAGAPVKVVSRCEEHGWYVDGPVVGNLCPVGRLEKAVEDGIAKILAEVAKK